MVYVEVHNEHQSNILMCFSREIRNRLGLSSCTFLLLKIVVTPFKLKESFF